MDMQGYYNSKQSIGSISEHAIRIYFVAVLWNLFKYGARMSTMYKLPHILSPHTADYTVTSL